VSGNDFIDVFAMVWRLLVLLHLIAKYPKEKSASRSVVFLSLILRKLNFLDNIAIRLVIFP